MLKSMKILGTNCNFCKLHEFVAESIFLVHSVTLIFCNAAILFFVYLLQMKMQNPVFAGTYVMSEATLPNLPSCVV